MFVNLTFEYRTDIPCCYTALVGVLTKTNLKNQERYPSNKQTNKIRDQESTCKKERETQKKERRNRLIKLPLSSIKMQPW